MTISDESANGVQCREFGVIAGKSARVFLAFSRVRVEHMKQVSRHDV
jgi:hypothetical protein